MKTWQGFLVMAGALTLAGFCAESVRAEPAQGTGILCDTPEQLESYIAAVEETKSSNMAVGMVNEIAGDVVCGVVSSIFDRGPVIKTVSTFQGNVHITQVIILATVADGVATRATAIQYTIFKDPVEATSHEISYEILEPDPKSDDWL